MKYYDLYKLPLLFLICLNFYSCKNKEKKGPEKIILTQESIDSMMRQYKPQSVIYKGVVANIGSREYNFDFDSGKNISIRLETKSPDLKMQVFEEKINSIEKDSVKTYYKKFELIADTIAWNGKMTRNTKFKVKLQLRGESAQSKNMVPFEMKLLK